jgi:hypothetical protein
MILNAKDILENVRGQVTGRDEQAEFRGVVTLWWWVHVIIHL